MSLLKCSHIVRHFEVPLLKDRQYFGKPMYGVCYCSFPAGKSTMTRSVQRQDVSWKGKQSFTVPMIGSNDFSSSTSMKQSMQATYR